VRASCGDRRLMRSTGAYAGYYSTDIVCAERRPVCTQVRLSALIGNSFRLERFSSDHCDRKAIK
jgi:hypothetical protein